MKINTTTHTTFIQIFGCILALFLMSCSELKQSAKYNFNEGYYKSNLTHKKNVKVYVVPGEDSIKVYTKNTLQQRFVDTTTSISIAFPANKKAAEFKDYNFRRNSFDIDVLNILMKYRPSAKDFPKEFITSILNGAIYFGYRTDFYHLHYEQTPLRVYKRKIDHYGFSFGGFTGIGANHIDEYVTQGNINIEYEGLVNLSGIAAEISVQKINVALALGFDHLLDKNKSVWIHQGKPWIGLALGLDINAKD